MLFHSEMLHEIRKKKQKKKKKKKKKKNGRRRGQWRPQHVMANPIRIVDEISFVKYQIMSSDGITI